MICEDVRESRARNLPQTFMTSLGRPTSRKSLGGLGSVSEPRRVSLGPLLQGRVRTRADRPGSSCPIRLNRAAVSQNLTAMSYTCLGPSAPPRSFSIETTNEQVSSEEARLSPRCRIRADEANRRRPPGRWRDRKIARTKPIQRRGIRRRSTYPEAVQDDPTARTPSFRRERSQSALSSQTPYVKQLTITTPPGCPARTKPNATACVLVGRREIRVAPSRRRLQYQTNKPNREEPPASPVSARTKPTPAVGRGFTADVRTTRRDDLGRMRRFLKTVARPSRPRRPPGNLIPPSTEVSRKSEPRSRAGRKDRRRIPEKGSRSRAIRHTIDARRSSQPHYSPLMNIHL